MENLLRCTPTMQIHLFLYVVLPCICIVYLLNRKLSLYHPLCLSLTSIAVLFGYRIYYIGSNSSIVLQLPYDAQVIDAGFWGLDVFLFGSYLTYFIVHSVRRRTIVPVKYDLPNSVERWLLVRKLSFIIYFISLPMGYFYVSSMGGAELIFENPAATISLASGKAMLYAAFSYLPATALLMIVSAWKVAGKVKVNTYIGYILFVFALVLTPLTGFRGATVGPLLTFLMMWSVMKKKSVSAQASVMVLGLMLLLIGFPILSLIRYGQLDDTAISSADSTAGSDLYGRYMNLEANSRAFHAVDNCSVPVSGGQQLMEIPQFMLPTFMSGVKPRHPGTLITELFLCPPFYDYDRRCTVIATAGFMYWQLGWFGVLLGSVFCGIVLYFYCRVFESAQEGHVLSVLFLSFQYFRFGEIFTLTSMFLPNLVLGVLPILVVVATNWVVFGRMAPGKSQ